MTGRCFVNSIYAKVDLPCRVSQSKQEYYTALFSKLFNDLRCGSEECLRQSNDSDFSSGKSRNILCLWLLCCWWRPLSKEMYKLFVWSHTQKKLCHAILSYPFHQTPRSSDVLKLFSTSSIHPEIKMSLVVQLFVIADIIYFLWHLSLSFKGKTIKLSFSNMQYIPILFLLIIYILFFLFWNYSNNCKPFTPLTMYVLRCLIR